MVNAQKDLGKDVVKRKERGACLINRATKLDWNALDAVTGEWFRRRTNLNNVSIAAFHLGLPEFVKF